MQLGALLEARSAAIRLWEITIGAASSSVGINAAIRALIGFSSYCSVFIFGSAWSGTVIRLVAGRLRRKLLLGAIDFFPIYHRNATGWQP
jgi:hypothetical protein